MRVAVFSTKPYDRQFLEAANAGLGHELHFMEPRLTVETARLAEGFAGVCVFVNDQLDRQALEALAAGGTRLVALRCAGFNNVDLRAAGELGVEVVRVPAYSPHAVAEFTVGLILSLNRRIHRAYVRTRDNNFALDGLLGFDLHGRTAGVIGTGAIGAIVARIMRQGFACEVLAYDLQERPELVEMGVRYTAPRELAAASDIITLHCPLTPQTRHIVNRETLARTRRGFMLVNTSRGALVDGEALIDGLKSGQIGAAARRLRAGGRLLLRGPLGRGDPGRCAPAPPHLPQRPAHRPSGLLHQGCADRHRRHDDRQHHRLRSWRASGEPGRRRAPEAGRLSR